MKGAFAGERYACMECPGFYRCSQPDMRAAAGGWETKKTAEGGALIVCRPGKAGREKPMKQYAFYCLGTPRGRILAGFADWTGACPKWCPRREVQKND